MTKTAEITLEYQDTIPGPPVPPTQLYGQACSNDRVTIDSWRPTWLSNIKANHEKFGPFKDRGLGKLFGAHQNQPCIIVGSGPSLKGNAHVLKRNNGMPVISCLHNFHFLEDLGVGADYYVTLDAGDITVDEVSEGGTKTADEYWAMTKGRKLLAYIATSPKLLEKWQGEIYFYNCPIPDAAFETEIDKIEEFHTAVSNGGNVLGACLYIAKAFFGCNPVTFIGASFSFGYDKKFHPWESKYDASLGHCVKMTDIYGIRVLTWQSYANFKAWFDYVACKVPGIWINCSEGGCLGSYPEGNIQQLQYMDLSAFFDIYQMNEHIREQSENPETKLKKILF